MVIIKTQSVLLEVILSRKPMIIIKTQSVLLEVILSRKPMVIIKTQSVLLKVVLRKKINNKHVFILTKHSHNLIFM